MLNASTKYRRACWLSNSAAPPAPWPLWQTKVWPSREALADELSLGVPVMSWHAQRDSFVEFAGWLSLVTGTLGKMAQDVILLAQTEVGEVAESGEQGRGGSSTMPQKSNPITSELILAAARTNASLVIGAAPGADPRARTGDSRLASRMADLAADDDSHRWSAQACSLSCGKSAGG